MNIGRRRKRLDVKSVDLPRRLADVLPPLKATSTPPTSTSWVSRQWVTNSKGTVASFCISSYLPTSTGGTWNAEHHTRWLHFVKEHRDAVDAIVTEARRPPPIGAGVARGALLQRNIFSHPALATQKLRKIILQPTHFPFTGVARFARAIGSPRAP